MKKILLLLLPVLMITSTVMGQPTNDKATLEKERADLQRELREYQAAYDQVKGKSKQAVAQLNLLNGKIRLQEQYISSISKEMKMIENDIYLSNLEIYRLNKQLDTLKTQYAKTLVYAYKNRSNYDYLNFIFSSSNFNDALKRIAYLKSYRKYREKQVASIMETQQLIAQRRKQQLVRKDQKSSALQNQTKQVEALAGQKKEKADVVATLKSQEKDLQKQIAARKKKDNDLKNALSAIVAREIEASRREAIKRAADIKKNTPPTVVTNTPSNPNTNTPKGTVASKPIAEAAPVIFNSESDLKLSSSFGESRARLPWPVDKGNVTVHFGNYRIEELNVTGYSPGITIATQTGSPVKAVFDGEVVAVFSVGEGMAVTLRHGKYFTTYSNLTGVGVSKGQTVKVGQQLGRAGQDDGGSGGQIDFILMIEKANVNPEQWLKR